MTTPIVLPSANVMTVDNPKWGAGSGEAHAATKPTRLARAPMRRSEAGAACRRILLVEDDETLALLITYNLQAHGHSVDWLARGDLVDRYIAGRAVDLVVLDWMLPGRSGLDICRCLRARADTQSIPIIMATALRKGGSGRGPWRRSRRLHHQAIRDRRPGRAHKCLAKSMNSAATSARATVMQKSSLRRTLVA